jgi:hypothetical protein
VSKMHQVFVGCPFSPNIRKLYDKLKTDLEKETPLHVVLADTAAISSTDYLLESITALIRDSATCIFDVTGGNPNVSLEVGVAHALPTSFLLALNGRKPRTRTGIGGTRLPLHEVRPIISDLQGRNRVEYKTYESLKKQVLSRHLETMPYFRRWAEFKKRHSALARHALQIFAEMRASGRTVRPRVITMLDGTGIDADDLLKILSDAKLLIVRKGRLGGIYYSTK